MLHAITPDRTGPLPVDESVDGGRSRSVTRIGPNRSGQITFLAGIVAIDGGERTSENGRQDKRARVGRERLASADLVLPCDQPKGQDAPYSTDMMIVPDSGVKRTSALQPGSAAVASRTTVPSSRAELTSAVQPWLVKAAAMANAASSAVMLTANEPLVAPAPVVAGSWPGSFGNDAGSESKIGPKPVTFVVGGPTLTPTTGLGPPGTAVIDGTSGDGARADELGRGLA